MDPVTGLSRRQGIVAAAVVVLGIVVSTVATVGSSGRQEACADTDYRCIEYPAGERVRIGLLVAATTTDGTAVREAVEAALAGATLAGRPVEVEARVGACSIDEASEHARELRSDTPDEPPAFAVIGVACPRALLPAAQILDDAGVLLATPTEPPALPAEVGLVVTGERNLGGIAQRLLAAGDSIAVTSGDELLVAPQPLRDALVAAGLTPA